MNFEILPIQEVALAGVLSALDHTFGPGHNQAWFAWKHLDNPHGGSLGWAAVGATGVLGIRLFMRWNLQTVARTIRAVRPVDTATVPEARRQGVFRALTEFAVTTVVQDPEIDLIFNTPNVQSRGGYARMGWTILPPIGHGIRPVFPVRTGSLAMDSCVFDAFEQTDLTDNRLSTSSDAQYMRWRADFRSGISYHWARLEQADIPNGIIYRMAERRGIRLLIINELTGIPAERNILVRSVARHEKAFMMLFATGSGAKNLVGGPFLQRGGSVLAVRPLRAIDPDPIELTSWALTLGDLEQVI